eukprot:COSAG01_NODE_2651_length_7304_cov_6.982799_2_plen_100_part_00
MRRAISSGLGGDSLRHGAATDGRSSSIHSLCELECHSPHAEISHGAKRGDSGLRDRLPHELTRNFKAGLAFVHCMGLGVFVIMYRMYYAGDALATWGSR